jgi:hypothetical protein
MKRAFLKSAADAMTTIRGTARIQSDAGRSTFVRNATSNRNHDQDSTKFLALARRGVIMTVWNDVFQGAWVITMALLTGCFSKVGSGDSHVTSDGIGDSSTMAAGEVGRSPSTAPGEFE